MNIVKHQHTYHQAYLFPIPAGASCSPRLSFVPCVIYNAMCFVAEWVHYKRSLVKPFHVTRAADVEVFVQKLFTSIAVGSLANWKECNELE